MLQPNIASDGDYEVDNRVNTLMVESDGPRAVEVVEELARKRKSWIVKCSRRCVGESNPSASAGLCAPAAGRALIVAAFHSISLENSETDPSIMRNAVTRNSRAPMTRRPGRTHHFNFEHLTFESVCVPWGPQGLGTSIIIHGREHAKHHN